MCGLAGFLGSSDSLNARDWSAELGRMGDAIRHRGPDDSGVWIDQGAGIGFVHRRLSIVDLSSSGHQPMVSKNGRYVIAYNGEIYNHQSLRLELEGAVPSQINWRGHSDTETLLHAIELWGLQAALKKACGMFALALWDKKENELSLARDRLGEKPLYYGWQGNAFIFASELKALKEHPEFHADIDRVALEELIQYSAIPAPHSIYQGIQKLLPGAILSVSLRAREVKIAHFWEARSVIANGQLHPFAGSPGVAVDKLELLLSDAISDQMQADVPLGAFLSGGVDSSVVVAMMQSLSDRPISTFTIGFSEAGYNEAKHAKAVAAHIGTDHTEIYISPKEALDVIPSLPSLYCEPFADVSQIPTYLVSQLAREDVSVSLSGDGGDELFGGYNRYILGEKIWNKLSLLPVGMRKVLSKLITSVSPDNWNRVLVPIQNRISSSSVRSNLGDKLHKGAGVISANDTSELYQFLISGGQQNSEIVIGAKDIPSNVVPEFAMNENFVQQMMIEDMITYLPDDILVKVDRAAMGVSLETRVPLLDHRLVEFAWSLPLSYKIHNGIGKWPLKQVLYKYLPEELIERPKMGFGVPIDSWLRGPLREWAEDLLDETRLKNEGYFNPAPIRQKWSEHLSGSRNWQSQLWNVLMFQAWLEGHRD